MVLEEKCSPDGNDGTFPYNQGLDATAALPSACGVW